MNLLSLSYLRRIIKTEELKHIFLCFIIHAVFLISIFDIYFQSPIVDGINSVKNSVEPSAKRIVLFVGDGVRIDKFFEINNDASTSFLRNVIEEKGRWGISRTRVPTESRPGHVAIMAGFYEDPSAIFKGWKDNPVEFDTIFNQSRWTFGWGSPDILLMFNKGIAAKRIFMQTYSSDMETFFGKNSIAQRQSLWSYEKLKYMISESQLNSSLQEALIEDKLIYFVHMLGTDTSGHADKPASKEYLENIRITDDIVRDTVHLINEFYRDNRTAFIYTSDHGMTDWGSHGDGSLAETETPFVAWGAGILAPQRLYFQETDARHSVDQWPHNLTRNDLEQIDISSLMAVLIGVPIPVHSIGVLPIDYLDMDAMKKNEALYMNAQQLYAQYVRKREIVQRNAISWLYVPFDDARLEEVQLSMRHTFEKNGYTPGNLMFEISTLIDYIRSGISYYHNYYQRPLLIAISLSYVGWIVQLMLYLVEPSNQMFLNMTSSSKKRRKHLYMMVNGIGTGLFLLIVGLLNTQNLPLQYHVYFCLPLIIWWNAIRSFVDWYCCSNMPKLKVPVISKLVIHLCIYGLATELLVFVFFERRILTVIMLASTAYQLFKKPVKSILVACIWIISSIVICVFPLLPVIGAKPDNFYLIMSGIIWAVFFAIICWYIVKEVRSLAVSFILLELTVFLVVHVTSVYSEKREVPTIYRICSWCLLCLLPLIPIFDRRQQKILPRILYSLFSYGSMMILFSVAHESLFMPCFSVHLVTWFIIEYENVRRKDTKPILKTTVESGDFGDAFDKKLEHVEQSIQFDDIRKSYFFFLYIVYSFFATGNMASINSFDISAVRCFVNVFSPFTMTSLLIVKIIIPFVAVTSVFRAINIVSRASAKKMFVMVLIFCSVMGLNFIFFVKNVGSWLEIGSSVSHYVIAQATTLCLLLIYVLTSFTYRTAYVRSYISAKYTD